MGYSPTSSWLDVLICELSAGQADHHLAQRERAPLRPLGDNSVLLLHHPRHPREPFVSSCKHARNVVLRQPQRQLQLQHQPQPQPQRQLQFQPRL